MSSMFKKRLSELHRPCKIWNCPSLTSCCEKSFHGIANQVMYFVWHQLGNWLKNSLPWPIVFRIHEVFFRAEWKKEVNQVQLVSCRIKNASGYFNVLIRSQAMQKSLQHLHFHQFCPSWITTYYNEYWSFQWYESWEKFSGNHINPLRYSFVG